MWECIFVKCIFRWSLCGEELQLQVIPVALRFGEKKKNKCHLLPSTCFTLTTVLAELQTRPCFAAIPTICRRLKSVKWLSVDQCIATSVNTRKDKTIAFHKLHLLSPVEPSCSLGLGNRHSFQLRDCLKLSFWKLIKGCTIKVIISLSFLTLNSNGMWKAIYLVYLIIIVIHSQHFKHVWTEATKDCEAAECSETFYWNIQQVKRLVGNMILPWLSIKNRHDLKVTDLPPCEKHCGQISNMIVSRRDILFKYAFLKRKSGIIFFNKMARQWLRIETLILENNG